MSWLGDILGLGGGGLLAKGAYDRLGDIGEQAQSGAAEIAQQGLQQSQFRPYTVTSGTGNLRVTDQGTELNLSPQQQQLQQMLGSGAQGFFSRAMQDPSQLQGDVYDAIRNVQRPGEDRQRLALEERLANQGRLGVRTSMFGGTPEQFSLDQAQGEARNQAALMAMQQAQAQRGQDAQLGQQFLQGQYLPQAALLNQGQLGLQNAGMAQKGQLYGAGLFGEANMGGLEALLGSGLGQANLMGQLGSGLLSGVFSPAASAAGTGNQGLFDTIGGWLSNL